MLSGLTTTFGDTTELINRVKAEVDCQRLVPDDGTREDFGRYVRQRCISPEHTDQNPTMLLFPDGGNCPSCGWKGDAIDIYRMWNPDAGVREACEALLSNPDLALDGEAQAKEGRNSRVLDPEDAIRYHLALASNKTALAGLMGMGFTPKAIQHYKMGFAEVLARVLPDEQEKVETAERIEWLTIKEQRIAYQRQMRFSVPVFIEGKLRQILYRKADPADLGAKVQMEKDCGAHLFGQDELAGAEDVIICEGWGDKVVSWQWGFVAVTSTNGAGHWNSDWNELLANAKRIYVVGDADAAGNKMMARVKRDLPWARAMLLPWPSGTKKDLRDGWLAGWHREDVKKLMRAAYVRGSWQALGGKR